MPSLHHILVRGGRGERWGARRLGARPPHTETLTTSPPPSPHARTHLAPPSTTNPQHACTDHFVCQEYLDTVVAKGLPLVPRPPHCPQYLALAGFATKPYNARDLSTRPALTPRSGPPPPIRVHVMWQASSSHPGGVDCSCGHRVGDPPSVTLHLCSVPSSVIFSIWHLKPHLQVPPSPPSGSISAFSKARFEESFVAAASGIA